MSQSLASIEATLFEQAGLAARKHLLFDNDRICVHPGSYVSRNQQTDPSKTYLENMRQPNRLKIANAMKTETRQQFTRDPSVGMMPEVAQLMRQVVSLRLAQSAYPRLNPPAIGNPND